jgi:ribosomal protein L37AE/L43A
MTAPLSDTSTRATAAGTNADACPYCRTSDGIRRVTGAGSVHAWACDRCDTGWAFTTVPDNTRAAVLLTTDLGAAAQEIGRRRWLLRQVQVVQLADDAPQMADVELRDRLLALANRATLVQHPALITSLSPWRCGR